MNEDKKLTDLVDAIYQGLPAELHGLGLDAEFNDDGTITATVGETAYNISVRREG